MRQKPTRKQKQMIALMIVGGIFFMLVGGWLFSSGTPDESLAMAAEFMLRRTESAVDAAREAYESERLAWWIALAATPFVLLVAGGIFKRENDSLLQDATDIGELRTVGGGKFGTTITRDVISPSGMRFPENTQNGWLRKEMNKLLVDCRFSPFGKGQEVHKKHKKTCPTFRARSHKNRSKKRLTKCSIKPSRGRRNRVVRRPDKTVVGI